MAELLFIFNFSFIYNNIDEFLSDKKKNKK